MFKRLIFSAVTFLFLFSGVAFAENWVRVDNLEMTDTGNGRQEVYIDVDSIVKNADGTATFLDRATVVGDKNHPGVYYWYARWLVKFTTPPQFRELEGYKEDPATKQIFFRTKDAGGFMTETPGISPKEIEFVQQAVKNLAAKDSAAALAAGAVESWATDPATGCRIGWVSAFGTVVTAASWTGPIANGLAEGQGTLTLTLRLKDGKEFRSTIDGEMKAGRLDGKGTMKWANGDSYSGDYKAGMQDGKGTYSWANGTKYDGEFKADYKNGYGVEKYPNGDSYEGDFKNNKREGQGIYRFSDGRSHEGEWKNDVPNGQGVRKDAAGNIVAQGAFRDGQPVGQAQAQAVSQAAPAGATLTGFLGIPWGTPKNETEKAILSRPDTKRWYGDTFLGSFTGRQAELCLEYADGKLSKGYVWLPQASTNEAQDVFNDMKAQLSDKYGKPVSERGAYVGAFAQWNVPGARNETNYVSLNIVTSAFLVDSRTLPDALRKPFSVVIAYYDGPVVDRENAQKKQNNNKDL